MMAWAWFLAFCWLALFNLMDSHRRIHDFRFNLLTALSWPALAWLWLRYQG